MNIQDIQKHIGQSVYVGTPYRGIYIGSLERVRPGEDGKPWRGDVVVTGIVSPPPLAALDANGLPIEKTTGYGIGDVIDAAAIFVSAPLPPDVTPEMCVSTLAEALRRDIVRWKGLLLDTSGTPERLDTPGLTRAERIQACIDRRVEQLAVALGDEPRAVRFGRAIKSAESRSQIKRLNTMAWDDDSVTGEVTAWGVGSAAAAVPKKWQVAMGGEVNGDAPARESAVGDVALVAWSAVAAEAPDGGSVTPAGVAVVESPVVEPEPVPALPLALPLDAASPTTKKVAPKVKTAPAKKAAPKPPQPTLF